MAVIRPFRAIRPKGNEEAKVFAALPYDVYSRAEAKEFVKANPGSFLAIDRAETQFDDSVDTYDDAVYEKAASMLRERIESGILVKDEKAHYYIYELTMNGRSQSGIVACASIDDYKSGVIKKHENTRADKEVDRIRHVDACSAQTGPIFLAYRGSEVISDIVKRVKKETESVVDHVFEDGIRHRVWVITSEEDTENIRRAFEAMDAIYIADGHHRCASAVKVGEKRREAHPDYSGEEEFNFFLSVLFPDDELMIMDYNRVVHDLNGLDANGFLKKLGEVFEIGEPSEEEIYPAEKSRVGMYLEGKWYLLTMKEEVKSKDPVDGLDVAILQKYVLDRILGIGDPKTDQRIEFVGGIRGLSELKKRVDALPQSGCAFAMYPTSIGELFAVADAGALMPPKSTWFEPKLRSGLFIHEIEK